MKQQKYVAVKGRMDVLMAPHTNQRFAPHFHEEYAFGVIVHGECRFLRSGVPFVARTGDIFVIHPRELHTGDTRRRGLDFRVVYPDSGWLCDLLELDGSVRMPYFPAAAFPDPCAPDLRAAIESMDTNALGDLLKGIVRRHADGLRLVDDRGEALDQQWWENPSSSALAKDAGLSRFHFIRKFRRTVGASPRDYSRAVRVMRAKRLIESGSSIAEAALDTRFADQSHLTREFKRVYGVTPGILKSH